MPTESRLGVDREAADELRRAQLDMQAERGERMTLGDVLRLAVRTWRAWGTDPGVSPDRAADRG